jgi:thymidylate kinase
MAMTLRLSEEETEALRARAEKDGISMHETVRQAVREYVDDAARRERILDAARHVMDVHAEALDRLGR